MPSSGDLAKAILYAVVCSCATAFAQETELRASVSPPARHPNPRVKLSYRRFAIAGLDGGPIWLDGAQLDDYFISRRWVRVGGELEGGAGHVNVLGMDATLGYGLAGLSAGFQYPARVTPFVEGRGLAGVLAGELQGTLSVAGATVQSASAVTWIYGGGVEGGIETYVVGRWYFSGAVGWVRTTWHGVDAPAMMQQPSAGVRWKDLTADSLTFKLGVGL